MRRRQGKPLDVQEKVCEVCGTKFVSRRAHQRYCGPTCNQYMRNRRNIDKRRRTDAPARVSPELIALRAAAIRPAWSIDPDLS